MRFPGWRTAFLAPQLGVALAIGLTQAGLSGKDAAYSPPRGSWEHRLPETCGMDSGRLRDAIEFSKACESTTPRDVALDLKQSFGAREPLWKLLGRQRQMFPGGDDN